jgi:hypothetical protein
MIILLFLLLPEDSNTFYLMDECLTLFSPKEEVQFTMSRRAIRITQGVSDDVRGYRRYEANLDMPLFSNLSLYYRFYKLDEYELNKEIHRFEFQWIPRDSILPPWTYSFVIAPASQGINNLSGLDLLGLGFGYWKNEANNHSAYIIVEDFLHNYDLSKETESLEDPYTRFPIRFEIEGKLSNDWANLFYYYCYTLPEKKNFILFDEVIGRGERGLKALSISSYYHLSKKLRGGLQLRYSERDSSCIFISSGEDFRMEQEHLFVEPFLRIIVSENANLHIGFPMDYKKISSDTVRYERKGIGISLLYDYSPRDWLSFPIGIQKSKRRLNGKDSEEFRSVLGVEFRFDERTYIALRGGIGLNIPVRDILKSSNSHVFIMLSHCF